MRTAKPKPSSYQLKITLLGIGPPIWRRIQVPSTLKLGHLHQAIQVVMGWTDSHLHEFEQDGECWGVPEHIEDDDVTDESRVPLGKVLRAEGDSMVYIYDFGDDWRHRVALEKIVPLDAAPATPVCLAGKRRSPPEDVGGPYGYQEFLEAIFDPSHAEFKYYRQWAGDPFHAEEFDVKTVNDILDRMRWPVKKSGSPA